MPVTQAALRIERRFDAARDRSQGRFVKDAVDAAHRLCHGGLVGNVAFDEFQRVAARFQVGAMPGAEIVQHANPIASADQGLCNVRANESGAAGNQERAHLSGIPLSFSRPRPS